MKKIFVSSFLTFIAFFAFASVAYANLQIIERLEATINSDAVNLEWQTTSENDISSFEVQRSSGSDFKTIHSKPANGKPSSYKYTDTDSFTKDVSQNLPQSSNIVTYRIKIVYSNNSTSFSEQVVVNRNVNSIKRTLGMLKEMFK